MGDAIEGVQVVYCRLDVVPHLIRGLAIESSSRGAVEEEDGYADGFAEKYPGRSLALSM